MLVHMKSPPGWDRRQCVITGGHGELAGRRNRPSRDRDVARAERVRYSGGPEEHTVAWNFILISFLILPLLGPGATVNLCTLMLPQGKRRKGEG